MAVAVAFALVFFLLALLLPPLAELRRRPWFLPALIGLVALAAVRSDRATRLDGFTIDEPYHIVAGVSYVRAGDFRLNPEHPPLSKIWVGAALPAGAFRMPPFRALDDKMDERRYTATAVFLDNDPDLVQRRARRAMMAFNGLFLLIFGLAVRRAAGEGRGEAVALGATAFLAIDPTVAAHLPVVMTDLPIALTSGTAVLLAAVAFRSWRARDLAAAALALGAALAAKHSGLVTLGVFGLLGLVLALAPAGIPRRRRFALFLAVLLGAGAVLWGVYGFRFNESREGIDLYNRPLAGKIADLRTPVFRESLDLAVRARLLPRSYLWGLADILRAGMEGRFSGMMAFGRWYPVQAPWYFFPGVLLVKLPLGLILLSLTGAVLLGRGLARKKIPEAFPALALLVLAAVFLVVLGSGEAYGGVRHAMPVFPALALLAGIALATAVRSAPALKVLAAAGLAGAMVSALPVLRPWEYYNELIGGTENGYLYFADEGLDLGQRTRELAAYYHRELRPRGAVAYVSYQLSREERTRRGLRVFRWDDGSPEATRNRISGTVFVNAGSLARYPYFDLAAFRAARPVTRLGNLFVYRGTFEIPWRRSQAFYVEGLKAMHFDKNLRRAEACFAEALRSYPDHVGAAVDLGNLRARRGDRDGAVRAFEQARARSLPGDPHVGRLTEQIERLGREDPRSLPPVRNPWAE